jgi:Ca2+-binding RTX toxin-like protein
VLFESAGNNLLTGGGGQDTFAFSASLTGTSNVTDFHVGDDKLAIIGTDTMQNLHVIQSGSNTVISFDNSPGHIVLANVNAVDFMQHASTEIVFSQTIDPLLHG